MGIMNLKFWNVDRFFVYSNLFANFKILDSSIQAAAAYGMYIFYNIPGFAFPFIIFFIAGFCSQGSY